MDSTKVTQKIAEPSLKLDCSRKSMGLGGSLVVRRLALGALTVEGLGSVPGRGSKTPQATQHSQKRKTPWSVTFCADCCVSSMKYPTSSNSVSAMVADSSRAGLTAVPVLVLCEGRRVVS